MNETRKTIKVLVVDESAAMRATLTQIINAAPDMRVIGTASNAHEVRESMKVLRPDVMTLDVSVPHVNGLELLERVMRVSPLPVIIVSNSSERGSDATLKALELGAVDFVAKPRRDGIVASLGHHGYANDLCDKVRAAYETRRSAVRRSTQPIAAPASAMPPVSSAQTATAAAAATGSSPVTADSDAPLSARILSERLVLIGASTGGTEAIKEVLMRMPEKSPGILIVQHMPEMFTESFAKRLDGLCRIHVKEARDGEKVLPGVAYIAPGHSHLMVKRVGGAFFCELQRGPPVNRHRPSVDVLFHSAAKHVGPNGVGVMLTGMGKDGAGGMLAMRHSGCHNICQDQESCVVWGMPREATLNGAAHEVAALKDIAGKVLARLRSMENRFV